MLDTALEFRSLRTGKVIRSHMIPRDEGVRGFTGDLPRSAAIGKLVPLEPVNLRILITNSGDVAGQNVLVVCYLENVFFSPVPPVGPEWKLSPKVPGWQLQWEGGRSVFPGEIPKGPSVDLTGMWVVSGISQAGWGGVVTYADDLKGPKLQALEVNVARRSGPATTAAEG
jgi:hypothetical protein